LRPRRVARPGFDDDVADELPAIGPHLMAIPDYLTEGQSELLLLVVFLMLFTSMR
jgi:hypothetical protein